MVIKLKNEKYQKYQKFLGIGIVVIIISIISLIILCYYPFIKTHIHLDDNSYYNIKRSIMGTGFDIVIVISLLLVSLLAIFLPFIKKLNLDKTFVNKIPFEFLSLILIFDLLILSENFLDIVVSTIFKNKYSYSILSDSSIGFTILFNFIFIFVILFSVFICVLSLRQVFTMGLIKYLKKRTLIGICTIFSMRCVAKVLKCITKIYISIINYISDIKLLEKNNKKLFFALVLNYIILCTISFTWIFSIFLLMIYSAILFYFLKEKYSKVKKEYKIILDITNQMANGNLDFIEERNLEIFNDEFIELMRVQEGFKKAVMEEIKSQNMKTELITNVSHDLKTPLTSVIAYVDLLKNENLSEENRKSYISVLEQKSERLKKLIEDLFEISKANSNNINLHLDQIDLVELIKSVVIELEEEIMKSNIEFKVNLPEEKIITLLDSEKTYRIFENLIINITKYAMPHTRAYIDIDLGQEIVVVLRNISAMEINDKAEQLMGRFVRGDASRNTEGSGLGLAIVKSFMEIQNGRVELKIDGDLFKIKLYFKNNLRIGETNCL